MASLKEIKQRIASVQGTKKVTSAMKMVSSAKLHKAQSVVASMLPYQRALDFIVANFMDGQTKIDSPYILSGDDSKELNERVAIVVFSSNSSLCGAFNYNVIKEFFSTVIDIKREVAARRGLAIESISDDLLDIYPIGKKIEEAVHRAGFKIAETEGVGKEEYQSLAARPSSKLTDKIARHLMKQFREGKVGKVILIYQHFKSAGVQIITRQTLLPLDLEELRRMAIASSQKVESKYLHNYIVEPSIDVVISKLLPQVVNQKLYTALADSFASEHAARTMAMQVATDNAEELIGELTILYNKSRQSAITAELLDILGGSVK